VNASRVRPFALRRGRAGCASRLATEGISGWWSARLSRGPRKTNLGGLRSHARGSGQKQHPRKRARRRRQRYQRRTERFARAGRTSPRVASSESRSEKRTVKRASPRSRLHRRAPSLPLRGDERLRTRGAVTRKTFAWRSTEPQGSGTRATARAHQRASERKSARHARSLRWEHDEARVLE